MPHNIDDRPMPGHEALMLILKINALLQRDQDVGRLRKQENFED